MSILRLLLNPTAAITEPPRHQYDGLDLGTPLECPEPTLTRQSEKDSCDINLILKRYNNNMDLAAMAFPPNGQYGDFTTMPHDYQEAVDRIAYAKQHFATLPLRIRDHFGHNAISYLDFLADPNNLAESIELGLRPKPEEPAAPPAPTPPAPPAPSTGPGTPPVA